MMSKQTISTIRLAKGGLVLGLLLVTMTSFAANYPAWWITRGVVASGVAATNDFAAINQGQLKWIVSQAKNEMDAKLPGGAGTAIATLVAGFSTTNNYLPVNNGQLKAIAKPFYDRLSVDGITNAYPWTTNTTTDDHDFAMANIGQVKNLFSFNIATTPFTGPTNGLVAFYRFNENAADTTVADTGPSNITGTASYNTSVFATDGYIKGAFAFTGGPSSSVGCRYVDLTTNSAFNPSALTVAAWLMFTNDVSFTPTQWFIARDGGGAGNTARSYSIGTGGGVSPKWGMQIGPYGINTSIAVPIQQWVHVAFALRYNDYVLYINGAPAQTVVVNRTMSTTPTVSTWIGGRSAPGSFNGFVGKIDALAFYNRVLTAQEIADLYNDGK